MKSKHWISRDRKRTKYFLLKIQMAKENFFSEDICCCLIEGRTRPLNDIPAKWLTKIKEEKI